MSVSAESVSRIMAPRRIALPSSASCGPPTWACRSPPKDVAMLMALLKVARIKAGDKADSFVDLAGYAACAGEIATGGKENPNV